MKPFIVFSPSDLIFFIIFVIKVLKKENKKKINTEFQKAIINFNTSRKFIISQTIQFLYENDSTLIPIFETIKTHPYMLKIPQKQSYKIILKESKFHFKSLEFSVSETNITWINEFHFFVHFGKFLAAYFLRETKFVMPKQKFQQIYGILCFLTEKLQQKVYINL